MGEPKKKFFTRKRTIRGIVFIGLLLLAFPVIVLLNRIINDYPLREYMQDKFIDQVWGDMSLYSSSSKTDEADLKVLKLSIDKEQYRILDKQINDRLDKLSSGDIQVMGTNEWDYVKASLSDEKTKYKVDLRIRGDMPSNYNRGIEEATMRLNVKGNTFNGKKTLSLIKPELESGYYGYLFYKTFKDEGFLSNHIELVQLYINDEYVGLRFLQEGFSKELLESSEKREGPIVRFTNDCTDCQGRYNEHLFPEMSAHKEKKTLKTESLSKNYSRVLNKYSELKNGNLPVENFFDIEQFARYFALCDIFLAHHSYKCQNVKMYFNPVNDKVEPIAWDPNAYERYEMPLPISKGHTERFGQLSKDKSHYPIHYLLSQNDEFLAKYSAYLNEYSNNKTIETMIGKYADMINKTKIELFRQNFQERFSSEKMYSNLAKIRMDFKQEDLLYAAFYREDSVLRVHSISNLPIKIDSVRYGDVIEQVGTIIAPNEQADIELNIATIAHKKKKLRVYSHILSLNKVETYKSKVFENTDEIGGVLFQQKFDKSLFTFNKETQTFKLKNKETKLTSNLYIPDMGMTWIVEPGTKLNLEQSFVVVECPIKVRGTSKSPVEIYSNHTGGLLIKNTTSKSYLSHAQFKDLSSPYEGNWNTTGAVTFYQADVVMKNCLFSNNLSEDALNIVSSSFEIIDTKLEGAASDALDVDFGRGTIKNVTVMNPKNDALDFSGSYITISGATLKGAGDKALSAGEETKLTSENIHIENSFIGVASKDSSSIVLKNSNIKNCRYNFTVYQKKDAYDKAIIKVYKTQLGDSRSLVELGCKLIIDNKEVRANSKAVYNLLYGSEE